MTTSPNLAITHIAASQTQKEVTANNAFNRLDAALTENVDISVSAGNATVTAAQAQQAIRITATGATVSGRTVTLPATKRMLVLMTSAASTQPVGFVRGTTTISIPPGVEVLAYVDGTANGLETVDGVGGLRAANNLSDVANAATARTNLGVARSNSATSNPGVSDDSAAGYAIGSVWVNTSTGLAFVCTSASAGAAVWQPIAAGDHPGYISGGIYPLQTVTVAAAAPGAVDIVYLAPFILRRVASNPQFGVRVAAAGTGSSFKIAVWANNAGTMRATGTPLVSNNTGGATNTSNQQVLISTTGTLLPGILYWVGAKFTGTLPTLATASAAALSLGPLTGDGLPNTPAGNGTTAFSVPDAFANSIASLDLTGASFTRVVGNTPIYLLGT